MPLHHLSRLGQMTAVGASSARYSIHSSGTLGKLLEVHQPYRPAQLRQAVGLGPPRGHLPLAMVLSRS